MREKILATDLDGTLIPLEGIEENVSDLHRLKELVRRMRATIVFVTGRHLGSVEDAISRFDLPAPDWIICDVGTSIYRKAESQHYDFVDQYADHLAEIVAQFPLAKLNAHVEKCVGLRIQEPEKQGPFKLSFYTLEDDLEQLSQRLSDEMEQCNAPWSIVSSVDPFTGDGLVDFLPKNVSKAYALSWWSHFSSHEMESIVFAGDSGNDLAALTAGYRSILVGNANSQVVEKVEAAHRHMGWQDRLYIAPKKATSGVLAGCLRFWT